MANWDADYPCSKECAPWNDHLRENGKYWGPQYEGWSEPNGVYTIDKDKECAVSFSDPTCGLQAAVLEPRCFAILPPTLC